MNPPPTIGFIGFGEAAYHIAKGLRDSGIHAIFGYDIHADTPGRGELIRHRAIETATDLVASNSLLADRSDIILSTVTANQASAAAEQTAPFLTGRHMYAELNSVSPGLKQSIAKTIGARCPNFVEVAVMAPVPPYGHKVPMLTGGPAAPQFAERLSPFGMQIETGSARVGAAAATKMCRSIMVKGIEALMTECVLGATHYGVDEKVLASLGETFPGMDWPKLASYLVGRVVVHGERRAREMEEVAGTLAEAGVEPIMVDAIVRRMDWSAQSGLRELFGGKAPASYQEFASKAAALQKTGVVTMNVPVPADIAQRIDAIAVARHVSRDRAMADLLQEAIAAYEERRKSFLELAGHFQKSTDPAESEQLRGELAKMTFGD